MTANHEDGSLGLVAGLALAASATAGLLGYQTVAAVLGVIGIAFAVALGLSKRAKNRAQSKN
ncbi:hypothetical protein C1X35_19040 [Pseudomonas sp. FW306-1C-G01A]|nr:hypothetical protein PkP19E3_32990 [Pseudomonas koreensis]PMV86697.1 hypothetical protein C1X56_13690 [Pseudomonas sp. GW101-1A09]PMV94454.1 hypothetical protein C1X51_12340 [Pseudomonas sp. FW306-2-2C-B10A]PMW04352.1 hypothetical protein C1X50_18005 [Pseudomonas sp. MPR-TSA4]PMW11465.1 hypothetical protein C1X52_21200 [Pseudomonas sp. FW306-2-1A-C05A]PMW33358.1 hypothetical protein C1X48_22810 [Pseudomonas sp. FW305-3-2-15-A-R2A1]PMW35826.1 hypothetical protein C1X49_21910 [Pseudomonas sp